MGKRGQALCWFALLAALSGCVGLPPFPATGDDGTTGDQGVAESSDSGPPPVPPPSGPECGDGVAEGSEECDLGAGNGNGAFCLNDCTINICGDGYTGPGETCDDGNRVDDDACTNLCGPVGCGDGVVQTGEQCDLGELNSNSGECLPSCINASCGDQQLWGDMEVCDASNFDGKNCMTEGFERGMLDCNDDCSAFDTEGCTACGDGTIEAGEDCEGDDFQEVTCASYQGVWNASGGSLVCDDCSINSSGCTFCGDGIIEGSEQCEPGNFNGATCSSALGITLIGDLSCSATCRLDTSDCCRATGASCNDSVPCCSSGVTCASPQMACPLVPMDIPQGR